MIEDRPEVKISKHAEGDALSFAKEILKNIDKVPEGIRQQIEQIMKDRITLETQGGTRWQFALSNVHMCQAINSMRPSVLR